MHVPSAGTPVGGGEEALQPPPSRTASVRSSRVVSRVVVSSVTVGLTATRTVPGAAVEGPLLLSLVIVGLAVSRRERGCSPWPERLEEGPTVVVLLPLPLAGPPPLLLLAVPSVRRWGGADVAEASGAAPEALESMWF